MNYKILLCLFLISSGIRSQEVLNTLSFYDDGNDGFGASFGSRNAYKDGDDLYAFFKNTRERDLWFGDQLVEHIPSPHPELQPWDYQEDYIARINDDMEVEDVLYVRNCIGITDYAAHNKKLYLSIYTDTLPLYIGDTSVVFEKRFEGAILVIDEEMELENVIKFGPNRITGIEANEKGLFYTAQINDYDPYMLVGQDTVYNYYDFDISNPGQQTQVLIHYDMEQESFIWHHRFGSSAREYIEELVLDNAGDIILTGHANAINWLTFNDVDSLDAHATGAHDEYFIAKFSGETGANYWAKVTHDFQSDYFINLIVNKDNSILLQAGYSGSSFSIGDTTLYNDTEMSGFNSFNRGVLVYLNADGSFKWAYQIDGELWSAAIIGFVESEDSQEIILSATATDGEFELGNKSYIDTLGQHTRMIITLNRSTGVPIRHVLSQTLNFHGYSYLDINSSGNLRVFLQARDDVEVLQQEFYGLKGTHYHLLEISPESLVGINDEFTNDRTSSVYPNPILNGEFMSVELEEASDLERIELYSLLGSRIQHWDFEKDKKIRLRMEVPQAGAYVLRLETNQGEESKIIYIE